MSRLKLQLNIQLKMQPTVFDICASKPYYMENIKNNAKSAVFRRPEKPQLCKYQKPPIQYWEETSPKSWWMG